MANRRRGRRGAGAARRAGPRARNGGGLQLREDAKGWTGGNPNKNIEEEKTFDYKILYATEYGFPKVDNDKLLKMYDNLHDIRNLVKGAIKDANYEVARGGIIDYVRILLEAKTLRTEIRNKKGVAIPIPSKLAKVPKVPIAV